MKYLLISLFMAPMLWAANANIPVGEFSSGQLHGWKEKHFDGSTTYKITELDERKVLHAKSKASASGMFKELKIDLHETPYLNWSWKVDNTLGNINERSREGDDYPARVYVVFSGGIFFWKTRAINYVWSSAQNQGSEWLNAYTDHSPMIAVQGKQQATGQWLNEKRNIREDYRRLFGDDIRYVDAVAIMTDTDNTGVEASAYYGDIYFSAE
jgi:hypothetical protein